MHLYDVAFLETHPLVQWTPGRRGGRVLQSRLLAAVELLRPSPGTPPAAARTGWARYHLVRLRYVDMLTVLEVCTRLGISHSEYYREHRIGIEAVIVHMLDTESPARLHGVDPPGSGDQQAQPQTRAITELPGGRSLLHFAPFVGRTAEIGLVKAVYETVVAQGKGALVLISGSAGIGKTRLAEECGTYAILRGGLFVSARYPRDGGVPYAPWIEVLRACFRSLSPNAVAQSVAGLSEQLASLIPEIGSGTLTPPVTLPEDQQARLYGSIIGAMTNVADSRPLVVLLDDLQWAPRLAVLPQVAQGIGRSRVLLLGAYRDQEARERPEIARDLINLAQGRAETMVPLGPFAERETVHMVSSMFGPTVGAHLGPAVHRTTKGIPSFVEDAIRSLAERGVVRPELTGWRLAATEVEASPPRLAITAEGQIGRLDADTRSALEQGAILGREFRQAVLAKMTGWDQDTVRRQLDGAAALLFARSIPGELTGATTEVAYTFMDSGVQEALLDGLAPGLRSEYHLRAARAIEELYSERLDDHASELAEHFAHSAEAAGLLNAVRYFVQAGRRAAGVHAHSTAARFFERALDVDRAMPLDRTRRCDILLALGDVLAPAGDPLRVASEVAEEAFRLAESIQDEHRASRACRIGFEALSRYGAGAAPRTPQYRRWTQRATRHARRGTVDKVYTDVAEAWIAWNDGALVQARAGFIQALGDARALGDPQALFHTAAVILTVPLAPQDLNWQRQVAEELLRTPNAGVPVRSVGAVLLRSGYLLQQWGDRQRAEDLWLRVEQLVQQTGDPYLMLYPLANQCVRALCDGRLERAVAAGRQIVGHGEAWGMPVVGRQIAASLTYRPLIHTGAPEAALNFLRREAKLGRADAGRELPRASGYRALCLAHMGQLVSARRTLHRLLSRPDIGIDEGLTPANLLAVMLETATAIGDRPTVALLAGKLEPAASLFLFHAGYVSVARLLGAAMTVVGDYDRARTWFRSALDATNYAGVRPEAALTRLQLAELLVASHSDNGTEVKNLLQQAITELADMNMRPSLERAQGLARAAIG